MPSKPDKIQRPWNKPADRSVNQGRYYIDPRYNMRRWRRMRAIGLHKQPWCVDCLRKEPQKHTPATVRDHVVPVRLGGSFWDENNHQSLCAQCHAIKSAKEKNKWK